jgi:hypothetical protein
VNLLYPPAIGVGLVALLLGAGLLYLGMKTPEDKKVYWGFGTYYDRFGICFRAIIILFIGAITFAVGFFY